VIVGLVAAAAIGQGSRSDSTTGTGSTGGGRKSSTRENCVLVFGASGRSGQACVKALLASGRSVVAACRSGVDLGLKAGEQESGAALFVETGVDVTRAGSIKGSLFKGVTQVSHHLLLHILAIV
jgi:NADP-dependent 3-hydroxy acid dehydrogenase YdfG